MATCLSIKIKFIITINEDGNSSCNTQSTQKEEIQQILPDYNITSLTDYNLFEEVIEDGDSFEANAK